VIARAFALASLVAAGWPIAAAAQECPNGQSGARGFVVERDVRSKTEVFHVSDTETRTILRWGSATLLETTQFQGLFDLERIDRGRRSLFKPTTDLSTIYPPNVGQKVTARFERSDGDRQSVLLIVLFVRRMDEIYIGPCRYRVLLIDRSIGVDNGVPTFRETDYYAPELKLIVAKEYKESGGRTSLNKFDRIYPIQR
jgi:hypothetical protein